MTIYTPINFVESRGERNKETVPVEVAGGQKSEYIIVAGILPLENLVQMTWNYTMGIN